MPLALGGAYTPLHRTGNALLLRRGCRQNLYSTDKPCIAEIVEEADENLFNSIRTHLIVSTSFYLDGLNPQLAI